MQYDELLAVCETISLEVTEEMSELVEKETRSQSKSSLWYKYRAGRITSSRMKAVCHIDPTNPSKSLVKSICYPAELAFTSKQTNWGLKQEKVAKELYLKINTPSHDNLTVRDSGLVINPQWPFVGASPDGLIECRCCGKGTLEIKCPYSHREESVTSAASNDSNFYLRFDDGDSVLHLDRRHAYYYQVQTQMFVCNVNYCDFCVCTFPSEKTEPSSHIERIFRDDDFWKECLVKAKNFFSSSFLRELLGKWYTRPVVNSTNTDHRDENSASQSSENTAMGDQSTIATTSSSQEKLYCYCRCPEDGLMIACDNTECKIEWFHQDCVELTSIPTGDWYCPDCCNLPQFLKLK